jgi:hypothetical protein
MKWRRCQSMRGSDVGACEEEMTCKGAVGSNKVGDVWWVFGCRRSQPWKGGMETRTLSSCQLVPDSRRPPAVCNQCHARRRSRSVEAAQLTNSIWTWGRLMASTSGERVASQGCGGCKVWPRHKRRRSGLAGNNPQRPRSRTPAAKRRTCCSAGDPGSEAPVTLGCVSFRSMFVLRCDYL